MAVIAPSSMFNVALKHMCKISQREHENALQTILATVTHVFMLHDSLGCSKTLKPRCVSI